jgi:recombination protein RecR
VASVRHFPEPIANLVAAFSRLPGVGPKTALRYVFYLLKQPATDLDVMARALIQLGERVQICTKCFTYTEQDICDICRDPKRDRSKLCVVEESRDISTIESTQVYQGLYHVLGGNLNPIEGMTPDTIRIRELQTNLEQNPEITEVILALSPTSHGEATMMYLSKRLQSPNRSLTRLARGLPVGATLEFADEVTLGDALTGRHKA